MEEGDNMAKSPQRRMEQKLTQTITVKRDAAQPEKIELIAAAILECARAAKAAQATGLKR